jgi:hypothetical protein
MTLGSGVAVRVIQPGEPPRPIVNVTVTVAVSPLGASQIGAGQVVAATLPNALH